jgi:hypothetical protein
MIGCIVYLMWIFKMFHGLLNNPVLYWSQYLKQLTILWDIMLCSPFKVNRRFGGIWLSFNGLHGVISQRTEIFITTTLRTSNLTQNFDVWEVWGLPVLQDNAFQQTFRIFRSKNSRFHNTSLVPTYLPTYIPTYLPLYVWLYTPFVGPWPLFSFLVLYAVGRTPWTGDQPVARPLPTHKTTQTKNKRTQISMPWVGFEPTIPASERAKTFHALDRVVTVIGLIYFFGQKCRNQHSH